MKQQLDILSLLHQEVLPAIGCTEPIAVALCVARAKQQLKVEPDRIEVFLSKNIYKNALAVGIPNTNMVGLPIAVALGATIGRPELQLEVLRDATPDKVEYAKAYLENTPISIEIQEDAPDILYIRTVVHYLSQKEEAITIGSHTGDKTTNSEHCVIDSLRQVYDYALSAPILDIRFLLDGAKMNVTAAEESFKANYGHGLGRLLHNAECSTSPIANLFGNTLFTKILSFTCGACDARMSGAMIPIMSNSGSGNQGISCSVPVYLYAQEHHCSEEQLIRALTLSNLTVIYIKQSLGRLSALCGCVVAATGSAVGLTYLMGGLYEEMTYAIKNMVANISGMICDGAKPGCALKVTSGVATAVLSAALAMQHSYADSIEGIVEEDIDRTIHNLTRIGHDGMHETDDLIIDIMTHKRTS